MGSAQELARAPAADSIAPSASQPGGYPRGCRTWLRFLRRCLGWRLRTNLRLKMKQYRKKPVVIEASQWQVDVDVRGVCHLSCPGADGDYDAHVHTIHDNQIVLLEPGDWIIPEPDGIHFYPCKPDIFEVTYETV